MTASDGASEEGQGGSEGLVWGAEVGRWPLEDRQWLGGNSAVWLGKASVSLGGAGWGVQGHP